MWSLRPWCKHPCETEPEGKERKIKYHVKSRSITSGIQMQERCRIQEDGLKQQLTARDTYVVKIDHLHDQILRSTPIPNKLSRSLSPLLSSPLLSHITSSNISSNNRRVKGTRKTKPDRYIAKLLRFTCSHQQMKLPDDLIGFL
ncbi:unnamed protein product [Musa acuminata subsp. burmannicoides]